jgi:hypothetical protein
MEAVFVAVSAGGLFVWIHVFHLRAPPVAILNWFNWVGVTVVLPLGALGPLLPMKGRDPQLIAADQYFKGVPGPEPENISEIEDVGTNST